MEAQTWLICHYKFISAENMTIISLSSDDFLHAFLEVAVIYSHPHTDCFVVSQLFNVARHIGHLKLGSKLAQFYVRLSIILFSQQASHVSSEL